MLQLTAEQQKSLETKVQVQPQCLRLLNWVSYVMGAVGVFVPGEEMVEPPVVHNALYGRRSQPSPLPSPDVFRAR